jgi:hypothetical protein
MHAVNQDIPDGPGLFAVTRGDAQGTADPFVTNVRKLAGKDRPPGSVVIAAATWLLVLLDAGLFYVSFDAQYKAIFTVKNASVPSMIEAAMLDAGMVILSALGIGLALRGKASRAERTLIVLCALASAGMNYAAADPASWRSVTAYVAAPVFLAVITDRVISVIRRHVLPDDTESAWKWLGRAVLAALRLAGIITLYALRTALAPAQTLKGLRQMTLDAAPLPGTIEITAGTAERELAAARKLPAGVFFRPHGGSTPHLILDHAGQLALCTGCPQDVPDDEEPPQFATKREAFEWHYRRHPQFGNRQAMSQVAKEIAAKVDLQWGTARTYAAAILAADAISDAMDAARECDEEAQR